MSVSEKNVAVSPKPKKEKREKESKKIKKDKKQSKKESKKIKKDKKQSKKESKKIKKDKEAEKERKEGKKSKKEKKESTEKESNLDKKREGEKVDIENEEKVIKKKRKKTGEKEKKAKKAKKDQKESVEEIKPEIRKFQNTAGIWNPSISIIENSESKQEEFMECDPVLEINRQKAVRRLQLAFEKDCRRHQIKYLHRYFENWIFRKSDRAGSSSRFDDPIIPNSENVGCSALVKEMVDMGANQENAQDCADRLNKNVSTALETLDGNDGSFGDVEIEISTVTVTGKKAREAALERSDIDFTAVDLTCLGVTMRINNSHYQKLKVIYAKKLSLESNEDENRFHKALFCLLVRYHTLQGGHIHGGGMQAALLEHTFDVMYNYFGVDFECFASPLNNRYSKYCSLFPDTDSSFGSVGSFFNFYPENGSFEANPPFEPDSICRMALHIELLLAKAEEIGSCLSFIAVVPAWEYMEGWKIMQESKFLQKHIFLPVLEHGFCEGTQHNRPTRYRISTCNTGVFFLQTTGGANKWPVSEEGCTALTESFISRHVTLAQKMAAKQQRKEEQQEKHQKFDDDE